MKITSLRIRENLTADATLNRLFTQFQTLLDLLEKRELPLDIVTRINSEVEAVNAASDEPSPLKKALRKHQNAIVQFLEKKLKLVPQKHYTKLWMVLGMSAFGLPFGVLLGSIVKNMGLMGVGLPFGMGIGTLLGASMDKKALKEGRQLAVELKP